MVFFTINSARKPIKTKFHQIPYILCGSVRKVDNWVYDKSLNGNHDIYDIVMVSCLEKKKSPHIEASMELNDSKY